MSEAPDLTEAEAFAAEHALGVLNAQERREAEARMAREPDFAAQVEAWRERLAPMADSVAAVSPPHELWRRIERSLPANDNGQVQNRVRFWRNSAMGGFSLAAASLAAVAVLVAQPPQVVTKASVTALVNARFCSRLRPANRSTLITGMGNSSERSTKRPGGRPEMGHHLFGEPVHHLKRFSGTLAVTAGRQNLVDAKLGINGEAVDQLGTGANQKVLGELIKGLLARQRLDHAAAHNPGIFDVVEAPVVIVRESNLLSGIGFVARGI